MSSLVHNLSSMNAQRHYNINVKKRSQSAEKLSSGYRINKAADDAAGLKISEKMRLQIRGLNKGSDNVQEGISLIQVADGALTEVQDMLHRMTELSIQAANDTNTPEDRRAIQNEIERLSEEITRIGTDTRFNTKPILGNPDGVDDLGSITSLITSSATDTGYLTDAIQVNGYWLPSATVDFSNINKTNIALLDGGGFSFNCSRGCNEVFEFTFKTDGTPSSSSNLSGKVHHYYTIDISKCKNGKDIVDEIFSYVSNNLPYNNGMDIEASIVGSGVNAIPGALAVSHSNDMIRTSDGNGLIIYANARIVSYNNYSATGYATEAEAKAAYPTTSPGHNVDITGKINCSRLTAITDENYTHEFNIQCSSNVSDAQIIRTHKVNARLLGVSDLDVTTSPNANSAIDAISYANDTISSYRSELGAYQNRLEHTYNNNQNMAENLQSAESLIRDTDMADEMINYSTQSILEQAGISIMAQANRDPQNVLALFN